MPTPFPGMDPYLEHPQLWQDVHARLIAAIGNELGPKLSPHYVVAVEERTYIASGESQILIGRPDVLVAGPRRSQPAAPASPAGAAVLDPISVEVPVPDEVTERYLEIRSVEFGVVVTVIELLSPANKRSGGRGFVTYNEKRETVLSTRTSLVEIDLLRAGRRPAIIGPAPDSDYRILVMRGWQRGRGQLYPFDLRHPIPAIPIPLRRGEEEPLLDLNSLLHSLYDQAVYNLRIDYGQAPEPPLAEADAPWASQLIAAAHS